MAQNGGAAAYKPVSILITGGAGTAGCSRARWPLLPQVPAPSPPRPPPAGFIASHVVIRLVNNYPEYKVRRAGAGRCQRQRQRPFPPTAPAPLPPPSSRDALTARAPPQIVVLDKLDYCASMNNLTSIKDKPNFKVRERSSSLRRATACALPPRPRCTEARLSHRSS
jgi:hypothetical protein